MELRELTDRAVEMRKRFRRLEEAKYGRPWSVQEVAIGLASDVGDVLRLVMAVTGRRDIANAEARLPGEMADCLWSLLVIAEELQIDLEKAFLDTIAEISSQIAAELDDGRATGAK